MTPQRKPSVIHGQAITEFLIIMTVVMIGTGVVMTRFLTLIGVFYTRIIELVSIPIP